MTPPERLQDVTLAEIVAEMRQWKSGRDCGPPPCVADWADRIEAAAALSVRGDAPMYGAMIEADFEANTITFEMRGDYVCAAGLYEIRPHVYATPPSEG